MVLEKATRDLATLDLRLTAFDALNGIVQALGAVATTVAETSAKISVVAETGAHTKLKKLRKTIEDARTIARDLGVSLGTEAGRTEAEEARAVILAALESAGIDPATVTTQARADAE